MSRIFVVEDEEAINRLICVSLTAAGYETVPAHDGQEALSILRAGERFDLTLLDVMLPGLDGFELLPHLKERDIPVIYLTAKNDVTPDGSVTEGLLVPVWNFYGNVTYNYAWGEYGSNDTMDLPDALFTINAIDGSVIDIFQGY